MRLEKARNIRRCALLLFPEKSLNPETLDPLRTEGFTDVGVATFISGTHQSFTGQGFSEEQGRELASMAHERGMGVMAFTGYMKYQEDLIRAEPERALLLSGYGSEPVPFHYLCPFRPENVDMYLELLLKVAKWPAIREIHLNDEARIGFGDGMIGCYCDHCSDEFERKFGAPPPSSHDKNNPLWWSWIKHRMKSWVELHADLRRKILSVNPDISVGIQHSPVDSGLGHNPWKSGIDLAGESNALDVLATDPYHHNHSSIFPYRPHGRILTEVTRCILGASKTSRTNIYTQAFCPPGTSIELARIDGLLEGIVPHSLGAQTITPYAYELMKINPTFFMGLKLTRKLVPYLQATTPYTHVTLLYPQQTEIYGHPEEDWGRSSLLPWAELMNRVGLPWRWLWDRHIEDSMEDIKGPIIVPDAHCLTEGQIHALNEAGGGVLWVGAIPDEPWNGLDFCPQPSETVDGPIELTPSSENPLISGLTEPIILTSRNKGGNFLGEVLGNIDGEKGMIISGDNRRAWITGRPLHSYVRPGDHGSVRTPTGGVGLIRSILTCISPAESLFELKPFPPENAYGELRPWDRRDQPTMELFPLKGDNLSLAIVFNYTQLSYGCELLIRSPGGVKPRRIFDIWTEKDLGPAADIDEDGVTLNLSSSAGRDLYAVVVEWK